MDEKDWFARTYDQHYNLLYSIGKRLSAGQPRGQDGLFDDLQEVFLALWRKRAQLMQHPNVGGWLVQALRLQVQSHARKGRREASRAAYSLDDQDASAAHQAGQEGEELDALLYSEKLEALERLLGQENARLFLAYAVQRIPARTLAAQVGVSEDCLRMRISRIKKKILDHPEIFSALLFGLLGLPRG